MDDSNGQDDNNHDSLREFVEEMRSNQNTLRSDETTDADLERINNFFERALSESKRMSKEVFKCHTQLNDLHAELGADNIANWTADHAKEVLSSEEYCLWREHQEETARELEQLKMEGSHADDSDTSDDVSH